MAKDIVARYSKNKKHHDSLSEDDSGRIDTFGFFNAVNDT